MSHNIKTLDRVVGLELHWHRLNEVVKEITFGNSGQAFQIQPLTIGDYRFLEPLRKAAEKRDWIEVGRILAGITPLEGWKAFECSDNGHIVHVAKESYTPIQPARIWEIVPNSLNNIPHRVVSAGTLGNRAKMYISVEILDGRKWQVDGQQYHNFLNFMTGNDGSMGLVVHDNSFKVVCENTFNGSLASHHNYSCQVSHTENSEAKIRDLERTIELITADRETIYAKLAELETKPCDPARADRIFMGFLTDKVEEPSTRTQNQVKRLSELFGDARKGNFARSLRNVFEAGTDYYTHEHSVGRKEDRNLWRQLNASEIGTGRNKKIDLFDTVTNEARLTETERRGEECFKLINPVTVAVGAIEDSVSVEDALTGEADVATLPAPAPKTKTPKSKSKTAKVNKKR